MPKEISVRFVTFVAIALLLIQWRTESFVIRPGSRFGSDKIPKLNARVPGADAMLHFYVLPVGQGDSHVIQCPNGDLSIVDLGTSNEERDGFWFTNEINTFLGGDFGRIRNVIMTHHHFDHYRLLPLVLTPDKDLSGLTNIYISCTHNDSVASIKDWVRDIQAEDKIRTFNEGKACGPTGTPCGSIDLCPGDPEVQAQVLAVNLNNCIPGANKNIDSLVFKIIHNQVTIMFNGDFEDETNDQNENGVQKLMADYYGTDLEVTVFKISHHGAQNLANKRVSCSSHKPKAIFVSANSWYSNYRHPRCDVIDRFELEVQSLCKPLVTDSADPDFCSEHPHENVVPADRIQRLYTCGENSTNVNQFRTVESNEYAVYTTVPDQSNLNIIKFSSDGTRWGFTNNMYPKARELEMNCGE